MVILFMDTISNLGVGGRLWKDFSKKKSLSFRLLICFYLSVISLPLSIFPTEPPHKIQNLDTMNELNSSEAGAWEVTDENKDPVQYSQSWLEGISETTSWKPYRVPGNLANSFPTPFSNEFRVLIKKEFILPESWNSTQFSLLIRRVSDRDKTYINGYLIGSTGIFGSKNPEAPFLSRIYDIPDSILRKGQKNLLLMEVEPYFDDQVGILLNEIKLGPSSQVYQSFHSREGIKVFLAIIYFFIGSIFIYIFLFRKDKKYYLFYALFNIFFSIQQIAISQILYDYIPDKVLIWHLPYIFLPPMFSFFSHFIRLYFQKSYHIIHKVLDIILFSLLIVILIFNDLKVDLFLWKNIHIPLSIIYIIISIYILFSKYKDKHPDSRYMIISLSLLIPAIIVDFLSNLGFFHLPQMISPIFILSFDVSLAIILSVHIEKIRKEIKELNSNLEEKVNQRTVELRNSLEQIQKLKIKEDNLHYFLSIKLKKSVDEIKDLSQLLLQLEFIENEERITVINKMYYESNDLFLTLQKLISWTLIQKKQEYGELSSFNLAESLSREFTLYQDLASRKDIRLNIDCRDCKLYTNKEKLIFIIRELLSNSLNFTPKNGSINLNIYSENNILHCKVSDSGVGIQKDDLEIITSDIERNLPGEAGETYFSLGIKISKIYLKTLNGEFGMRTEPGNGTEVFFSIPLD